LVADPMGSFIWHFYIFGFVCILFKQMLIMNHLATTLIALWQDPHSFTYIHTVSVLLSALLITSSYLKKTTWKKIRHWCHLFACHLFSQLNNLLWFKVI
jgi:hypothetical protein